MIKKKLRGSALLPRASSAITDLGGAPGRANTGDKMLTGWRRLHRRRRCIAGTVGVLGCPRIHPGERMLRQLDRVREAGPGLGRWGRTRRRAVDHRSTICETYGLAKEGARHHGYPSGAITRCWPSPPARGADVSCARAGPTPPAAPPTSCVRPWAGCATAGARGQLTVRADSGFYAHALVGLPRDGCPLLHHHPQHARLGSD